MKASECTRIFSEVLNLNRQLLLWQIRKIEDEIIPLADVLQSFSGSETMNTDKENLTKIITSASRKIAILNSLKHELCRTEAITYAETS